MAIEPSCENTAPGYVSLFRTGALKARAQVLDQTLRSCTLCPRRCRVDRKAGQVGACSVGDQAMIAAIGLHPWEEPPISGERGSGTVFFSGCPLRCLYCQNYPISQMGVGRTMTCGELAESLLKLQHRGAHNVNLVTSTHQMPAFLQALLLAVPQGFRLPVVYNSSGYESLDTLRLLEGIVDVYLPDIKYADPEVARFCCGRSDYVAVNREALLEMWRQVGPLRVDANGLAYRGMLVRHLVLPGKLAGTENSLKFLRDHLGPGVWISLMNQYFPAHRALDIPPLNRKTSLREYEQAFEALTELGIENGFVQECELSEEPHVLNDIRPQRGTVFRSRRSFLPSLQTNRYSSGRPSRRVLRRSNGVHSWQV